MNKLALFLVLYVSLHVHSETAEAAQAPKCFPITDYVVNTWTCCDIRTNQGDNCPCDENNLERPVRMDHVPAFPAWIANVDRVYASDGNEATYVITKRTGTGRTPMAGLTGQYAAGPWCFKVEDIDNVRTATKQQFTSSCGARNSHIACMTLGFVSGPVAANAAGPRPCQWNADNSHSNGGQCVACNKQHPEQCYSNPPAPQPTDCVLGSWQWAYNYQASKLCNMQYPTYPTSSNAVRYEERAVTTPAANGGTCPSPSSSDRRRQRNVIINYRCHSPETTPWASIYVAIGYEYSENNGSYCQIRSLNLVKPCSTDADCGVMTLSNGGLFNAGLCIHFPVGRRRLADHLDKEAKQPKA